MVKRQRRLRMRAYYAITYTTTAPLLPRLYIDRPQCESSGDKEGGLVRGCTHCTW